MSRRIVFVFIILMIPVLLFSQSASGGKSRRSAPAATYQLTVNVNVGNYQIFIDGQAIKGNRATLQAGVYTVTVRANGYYEWQHSVNLTGNETITANLQQEARTKTSPERQPAPESQSVPEPPSSQGGMPVTFHWHAADTADIYINGQAIKVFNPNYEVRRDEAPLEPFELDWTIKEGDVITVGTRRGGSYGFMMVAVNRGGQVVVKSDENWRWYDPAGENVWFQPAAYERSNNRRQVGVNPNPWGNQNDLVREYGSDVKAIYSPDPGDRTAHLYYKVSLSDSAGSIQARNESSSSGSYQRLQMGETVTVDMQPGSQTEFRYEFVADRNGEYKITAYQRSGGFFDDSKAILYDQSGNQIASPTATEVGQGYRIRLNSGTYRLHIEHIGGPANGMTRVEYSR